jgi:hypothetical protein
MTIMHYTGHMIAPPGAAGRFPATAETAVTCAVIDTLKALAPTQACGSLAGGADTIIVEALLAQGATTHVFLPFPPRRFVETSVARCGTVWVSRFEAALARVSSVTVLPSDAAPDEDGFYTETTRRAMRAALDAGAQSCSPTVQLAVWDGKAGQAPAGTWHDIHTWRAGGGRTISIDALTGARTDLGPLTSDAR